MSIANAKAFVAARDRRYPAHELTKGRMLDIIADGIDVTHPGSLLGGSSRTEPIRRLTKHDLLCRFFMPKELDGGERLYALDMAQVMRL